VNTKKLQIYQSFNSLEQARRLADLLDANHIKTNINHAGTVDAESTLPIEDRYSVQISPADFDSADGILEAIADKETETVDYNYYLLDFTNEELKEVVAESEKWNKYDYVLAKKLLNERGDPVSDLEAKGLKEEYQMVKRRSKKIMQWLVWPGYIGAIAVGVIGIVIGNYIMRKKANRSDGKIVNFFDQTDQAKGREIMVIGMICLLIELVTWNNFFKQTP
jgi:hypothetical protein